MGFEEGLTEIIEIIVFVSFFFCSCSASESMCSIRWKTERVSERVGRDDQRAAQGGRGVIGAAPD